jgi:hypothetical protein
MADRIDGQYTDYHGYTIEISYFSPGIPSHGIPSGDGRRK